MGTREQGEGGRGGGAEQSEPGALGDLLPCLSQPLSRSARKTSTAQVGRSISSVHRPRAWRRSSGGQGHVGLYAFLGREAVGGRSRRTSMESRSVWRRTGLPCSEVDGAKRPRLLEQNPRNISRPVSDAFERPPESIRRLGVSIAWRPACRRLTPTQPGYPKLFFSTDTVDLAHYQEDRTSRTLRIRPGCRRQATRAL